MQKVILVIFLSCLSLELFSLPKYLATAGRNCQNCHSMKRLSENPRIDWEKMSYVHRRMSLSCKSCHINPGGGGIRTVVGRYYSQTSLPMFHISKHPDTKKNSPDERDKIPSHKAKFFYSNDFLSF
ncbi:MAG: hypothetical protein OEZ36_03635, partial [Spirochaetota bacterium]|nr:hypothetical protein [Spirochaetota bacterium]